MKPKSGLGGGSAVIAALAFVGCTTPLGGEWTPSDINEDGVVIGQQRTSGPLRAMLHEQGTLVQLPDLSPGSDSAAVAIADNGTVTGNSAGHVVTWDRTRTIHDLGRPSDASSVSAANNGGVMVGTMPGNTATSASDVVDGWVRDPVTAQFLKLPSLPNASETRPTAINDNGEIAGSIRVPTPPYDTVYAVKWAAKTRELKILPAPAAVPCNPICENVARGINSAGVVVGYGGFPRRPILWPLDADPIVLPIGTHVGGIAYAINDDETVVGVADDSNFEWGIYTAARWKADRKLELLYTPDPPRTVNGLPRFDNSEALALNNAGVAVGPTSKGAMIFR